MFQVVECMGQLFLLLTFVGFLGKVHKLYLLDSMKKIKDAQKNMYPHSEVKVRLLRKYLEIYLRVLNHSSYVSIVHLYDVFCGPGLYENGGLGSPLVMLEEISKIAKKDKKTDFFCYFNDSDSFKIDKLKEVIRSRRNLTEFVDVKFLCKDYKNYILSIIDDVKFFSLKEKAFIFIDPYQYKDIRLSNIENLLHTKKAEVLLFLPIQFMFRFHKSGTPECLKEFIEEIMPENEWPILSTSIEFIEKLKERLKNQLGDDYYVDTFIIEREKGQYFCLFFFTSNIYGFEKMLEAKWKVDEEQGRGWRYQRTESLFSGQKPHVLFDFKEKLKDYLLSPKTNKEVYEFTLHWGHLPKHANEILVDWQGSGVLSVLLDNGENARKKSFYLNYDAWRENPEKVVIEFLKK